MIESTDTPPSILELLDVSPATPRQIALHVTVEGRRGRRAYWMTEGGALFFRRLDGQFCRANLAQTASIMRGLELARRSSAFDVQGRVAEARDLDQARGLAE
jgi:hypothetical protein